MKIKNKVLSLISSCVLITSAGKISDACFLRFIGCVGGFVTVINLSKLLGSLFYEDKSTKARLGETVTSATFTLGMFGLDYLIDKYCKNKEMLK